MVKTKPVSTAPNLPARLRIPALLLPYVAVGGGLLAMHSAWIATLGYHLGMIAFMLFARRRSPPVPVRGTGGFKPILVCTVLGAAAGLLLYLCWPLLGISRDIGLVLQGTGLTGETFPYFVAYFVLVNPWLEEYYWRGYLGSNSKRIVLHDFVFSGYHLLVLLGRIDAIWLVALFAVLSLGAWLWRQADRWDQGLTASMVSHAAADISVMMAVYFMIIRV